MRARIAKKFYQKLCHAYHAQKFGTYDEVPFEIEWQAYMRPAPWWREPQGFRGTMPTDECSAALKFNDEGKLVPVWDCHTVYDWRGSRPVTHLGCYKKLYGLVMADLSAWRKEQHHAGQCPACSNQAQG